jgi:mono/diheme cytochrome c family protein
VHVLRTGEIEYPGAGVYNGFCARCHQADGRGVSGKYPRLAGNPIVVAPRSTSLIRLLIDGSRSPETIGGPEPHRMPSFVGKLNDTEMARVLTFIRNAWGNEAQPVAPSEVTKLREALHR